MRKRPLCAICLLFLLIQVLRICLSGAESCKPSAPEQKAAEQDSITVEGTVTDIQNKEKVTAVILKDCLISMASGSADLEKFSEKKIMVYVRPDSATYIKSDQQMKKLKIANRIRVAGEAALFEEARNPGNFDQRVYYARQDIHLLVWADDTECLSADTDVIRQFLLELRLGWNEMLIRHLGEYYGGTMSAILLGEKGGLDAEMKKLYQKNGIGHLLAISGLHMSFIGMGIYSLLRKTGLGFLPSGLAGGAILMFYTLMIGAGVSSLRALVMFLMRMGAEVTGRDYDLPTSLALAAAVLSGWQPLYLTDAGFLLSFGALLGIVLSGPVFEELLLPAKKMSRFVKKKAGALEGIAGSLAVSLAVNVMLLGPVLYFYFEVPPYSVFLNLLVIPLMSVVMGAGVGGSALALVWEPLGGMVLKLSGAVLWGYDRICEAFSRLPGSRFVTGRPETGWIIGYYAGILILCGVFYYLRYRQRERDEREPGQKAAEQGAADQKVAEQDLFLRLPGAGMVLLAVLMTCLCRAGYHEKGEIRVTALDVGQGDSIHICGETGNYLIDGGSSDVSSVGIYRIEPYLLSNAVDTLDYVFVTHGDEDHISGIHELLEDQELGVRIETLVLPPEKYCDEKLLDLAQTARENNTRVVTMSAGQNVTENAVFGKSRAEEDKIKEINLTLTCLGPEDTLDVTPGNAASLVLSLSYGEFDMLLTGDVEEKGEDALVVNGVLQEYDVLKAAHHGSKNSSSDEFLKIVKPSAVLISAGEDNRYGHPHEETLARFADAGCTVYSTQEEGAVRIWTDGENMKIQHSYRE